MLSPVDSKVIDDSYIEEVHEEPVEEVFNEENSSEMYEENEVQDLEQIDSEFVAQKILDGDKLTQKIFVIYVIKCEIGYTSLFEC